MFGFEYILALMKVMINIGFAIVVSIPFSISWNCIAPKYFAVYLPMQFMDIPFWHFVAFILVARYVGEIIQMLMPSFVEINQSTTN